MTKPKSGAAKRKQKKLENQFIESQKGAIKMFFPVLSTVDNQRRESEPGQDDDHNFFSELKVLQVTLPDDLMSAPEILQFVTAVDCYPNVSVAYRILLTVPVTVASAERSFSKLKLLKNCLRLTMLQDRLNGLAMCSVERISWTTLILILSSMILLLEMPEEVFS